MADHRRGCRAVEWQHGIAGRTRRGGLGIALGLKVTLPALLPPLHSILGRALRGVLRLQEQKDRQDSFEIISGETFENV